MNLNGDDPTWKGVGGEGTTVPTTTRPIPPLRKYRVPLFAGSDHVSAYRAVFLPDWLVFEVSPHDHETVIAYPTHVVRGAVTEEDA